MKNGLPDFEKPADLSLRASCCSKPSVAVETGRDDEVLITGSTCCLTAASDQVSTLEERSLLSFQRPVPVCSDGVKKPPTRARGLRGDESYRIRVGPGRLLGRGSGHSYAVLSDGRRSIAAQARVSTGRNGACRPAAARPRARRAAGRARTPARRSPSRRPARSGAAPRSSRQPRRRRRAAPADARDRRRRAAQLRHVLRRLAAGARPG